MTYDALNAAHTAPEFILQLLEAAAGVTLDSQRKQTMVSVLSGLPENAILIDLLNAVRGLESEQSEPLKPLLDVMEQMQKEGVHATVFDHFADLKVKPVTPEPT